MCVCVCVWGKLVEINVLRFVETCLNHEHASLQKRTAERIQKAIAGKQFPQNAFVQVLAT